MMSDSAFFKELLEPYINNTSENYIYNLKASDMPRHMKDIAAVYYMLNKKLRSKYSGHPVFDIFRRVYKEHFTVKSKKAAPKKPEELSSGSLQSPDDIDATFRNKNGKKSKGQSIDVFETANPENPINLIDDVSVYANNVNDEKILNDRIGKVKKKTPSINELHFDGAFGSADNDIKFEELSINPVQTAIKGKTAKVDIQIERVSENQYKVRCQNQSALSETGRKREKARFDLSVCSSCQLSSECPAINTRKTRTYYFTEADYLKKKRFNRINEIPKNRRKLRNNIEATVAEFTRKMPNKKLKARGYFKTALFAYTAAIAINFGRIFRYKAGLHKIPVETACRLFYVAKERLLTLINRKYGSASLISKIPRQVFKYIGWSYLNIIFAK